MPTYYRIGDWYDATRRADPYISGRLAHHLGIGSGGLYLDVACGTGNYTLALARTGGSWCGVDQSSRMIGVARRKGGAVDWEVADAARLPYADGTFSGAMCTLAIHHFDSLEPAFAETYRVLLAGRFVVFTATPEQIEGYWLVEYFPEAIRRSAEQMPGLDEVSGALREAGFEDLTLEPYAVREDLQDLFLYGGKHRPGLYLDPGVRRQITTFALIADQSEVERGCQRLASDIETGRVDEIIEGHPGDEGDYLFVTARKG